jgi:hypothetical protein
MEVRTLLRRDGDQWRCDDDDDGGEAQIYGYAEEGQAYAPEQPARERGLDEGWEELDRENPYDLDDA